MSDYIGIARRWRERFGYVGRGGVVVVFNGEADGWVNELRNPETWRPGCVAVDESGRSWTAVAGDDQHGALVWVPNDADSSRIDPTSMEPAQSADVMRHEKKEGMNRMTNGSTYRQPSITGLSFGRLHRAIVSLPRNMSAEALEERVVFFECPRGEGAGRYLESLLSKVWCIDTTGFCEDGNIYNVHSAAELQEQSFDPGSAGTDLALFETGAGGGGIYAIGPHRIHYARSDVIDLFVTPRVSRRLKEAMDAIDLLYIQAAQNS